MILVQEAVTGCISVVNDCGEDGLFSVDYQYGEDDYVSFSLHISDKDGFSIKVGGFAKEEWVKENGMKFYRIGEKTTTIMERPQPNPDAELIERVQTKMKAMYQ